ncbi:hypothetical protein Nepgr_031747 [Nepenthes gracilis]|uniref:Uncharacterized protein n=1 Tax=Nepenthes gracilis TaxID=150966 RepID=A0AAD3TIQ4_NEPGR|nr:hypothetical protein Nepgr_031747 [Nepenthes gracilis]
MERLMIPGGVRASAMSCDCSCRMQRKFLVLALWRIPSLASSLVWRVAVVSARLLQLTEMALRGVRYEMMWAFHAFVKLIAERIPAPPIRRVDLLLDFAGLDDSDVGEEGCELIFFIAGYLAAVMSLLSFFSLARRLSRYSLRTGSLSELAWLVLDVDARYPGSILQDAPAPIPAAPSPTVERSSSNQKESLTPMLQPHQVV